MKVLLLLVLLLGGCSTLPKRVDIEYHHSDGTPSPAAQATGATIEEK